MESKLILDGLVQRDVERAKIAPIEKQSTAFTNGLWNAFGNIINFSVGIVGSLIVVRTLSTADYGTLSYYLWLSSILSVLGLLAFPHGHTKIVSELRGDGNVEEANQLSAWATSTVFFVNLVIGIGILLYASFSESENRSFLFIVAGMLIPSSLSTMLGSRLSTLGRYSWSSIGVQISSIIQLGILVWGYFHHWGPVGFAFGLLSPSLFQVVYLAVGNLDSIHIYNRAFRRPKSETLQKYIHFLIPLTLVVLYERVIWDRSEIFFIKIFGSESQIGYYNLAYTVFAMFLNVGLALINGYWPAISREYGAGRTQDIGNQVRRGVSLSVLYATPLVFGGWVTLHSIMISLYGVKMEASVPIAKVLIVGLLPGVVNGMFSLTLSACGHVWTNVKVGLMTSAISIGLDIVLISHFDAVGGAISCTIAQVINCIILMFVVLYRMHIWLPWRQLGGILTIGALTTLVIPTIISDIYSGIIGLVLSVVLGGVSYSLCILKFGFIKVFRE